MLLFTAADFNGCVSFSEIGKKLPCNDQFVKTRTQRERDFSQVACSSHGMRAALAQDYLPAVQIKADGPALLPNLPDTRALVPLMACRSQVARSPGIARGLTTLSYLNYIRYAPIIGVIMV
jgi:hypothetical protein